MKKHKEQISIPLNCTDEGSFSSWLSNYYALINIYLSGQKLLREDEIAQIFRDFEAWKLGHLLTYPEDKDLSPSELIDLYCEEKNNA